MSAEGHMVQNPKDTVQCCEQAAIVWLDFMYVTSLNRGLMYGHKIASHDADD